MDLDFNAEELEFRQDVRNFLKMNLPARLSGKVSRQLRLTKQDHEEWHATLAARGWLASYWPEQWGGTGWTVAQRFIFDVECAIAHAPEIIPFGLKMLGPILIQYGTHAQKQFWLPRILTGADWWCQGFSEPGAGSDLAALRCSAKREGDEYIVNGQKTWTTHGQYANMIFCLVRTSDSGKKQQGISFLLIDMESPGVELRPIKLLDGEHEVNEIFFTDVHVPVANLIGEENLGWTYAKYLLTLERTNIAGLGQAMAAFRKLQHIAQAQIERGESLARNPLFAARMARLEIDLENMKTTNLRVLAATGTGASPVAESSMLKIRGTEIRQEITSLARRALGPYAQPFVTEALDEGFNGAPIGPDYAAPIAADYLNNRKLSIYGGSNEIQREIIAKAILEL